MPDANSLFTVPVAIGKEGSAATRVSDHLTAPALGSGSIAVYGTPAMIALMEEAAVACVDRYLAPGHATVGLAIDASHIAATPLGAAVSATATLTALEGRKLTFAIVARDTHETIGTATHVRFVVDVARFEQKLASKGS